MRFSLPKGLLALALIAAISPLVAQEDVETIVSHGLSSFGNLKYPADFEHFDYVNPDAPKGGVLSHTGASGTETFDTFHAYIFKGTAPEGLMLSSPDGGGDINFDSLMIPAADEPGSVYGLVAYEVEYPEDRSWVIFRLRPEARFHDGSLLTAEDVKFSLDTLKEEGDPRFVVPLQEVEVVEVLGPHEIRVVLKEGVATRDLPMQVALYPIYSKAYFSENDFTESSLDKPLSSGPYRIGNYRVGYWIEYERVEDYWARDLPVNRGRWNFDVIRYEFYRDDTVQLEAFRAHEYSLNLEVSARSWVQGYDFAAVRNGEVLLREFPDMGPAPSYGFYINTRRPQFSDPRVRKALDLAFDFEWFSKNLFYDQYQRITSYFQGTDMEAKGLPTQAELELLEPFRDQLPSEVFGEPYTPPVSDGSGNIRDRLREALGLLQEAGWRIVDGRLVDEDGEPFEMEYVEYQNTLFRITGPYFQTLQQLGIHATNRLVDPTQYEQLMEEFDFDITSVALPNQTTPAHELRDRFGSQYANSVAGWNISGINDPVVDAMVEAVISAESREELAAAGRALDRVLRSGHYWISNWYVASFRTAFWDEFNWPETAPIYQRGLLDTWWSKSAE